MTQQTSYINKPNYGQLTYEKKLSPRKLSGAVDYATSYKKEWEQKNSISPGGTATGF